MFVLGAPHNKPGLYLKGALGIDGKVLEACVWFGSHLKIAKHYERESVDSTSCTCRDLLGCLSVGIGLVWHQHLW